MRVLIIGGSGRTGQLVISSLLQRGHSVTALVRNPTSLKAREGLTIVIGTPMSISNIRTAVQALPSEIPKVVISTMSAPRESDSPFAKSISPRRLMADSNANVIRVMEEFGIPKIVIMQAFGVGESWDNMNWMLRLLMSMSNMSLQYDDHNLVDRETKSAGITYVLVRPNRLVDGDAKEVLVWENHGKGIGLLASISRASVADWLVEAAEESKWDNTCPVIAN